MSLHHISMAQALGIWSDLCDAYHGKGWGGDTAEIYMYRLMPDSPYVAFTREPGKLLTGQAGQRQAERVRHANDALFALLSHFAEERDCKVFVNGVEVGAWLTGANFDHRVHVRVVPK